MADGYVQVAVDSTGKKVDASELTVNALTVERQRVVLASDGTAAGLADVTNAQPASTAYGLPVRPVGDNYVALNGVSITAVATLGTFETTGYASFNLQVAGTFNASVIIEESNDNANWTQVYFFNNTAQTLPTGTSSTVSGALPHSYGFIKARYIRARCTAFTSNTSSAFTLVLRTAQLPLEYLNINTVGSITNAVPVTPNSAAAAAGIGTTAFVKSGTTNNATSVKASAGNILSIFLTNGSTAVKYLKLYNKASAPTYGTDIPVAVLAIGANGGTLITDGNAWGFARFSTGIAYAITGAAADSDTVGVTAANDVSGWIVYG